MIESLRQDLNHIFKRKMKIIYYSGAPYFVISENEIVENKVQNKGTGTLVLYETRISNFGI